jgi:hypothetical protein
MAARLSALRARRTRPRRSWEEITEVTQVVCEGVSWIHVNKNWKFVTMAY